MIIRKDQMVALGAEQHRAYVRRMSRYLAGAAADSIVGMDPDAISERIEKAVRRAAQFGFRSERNTSIFVELAFCHGDEFELSPAFAPVLGLLRHPAGPPDAKADILWRHHQALRKAENAAPATTGSAG